MFFPPGLLFCLHTCVKQPISVFVLIQKEILTHAIYRDLEACLTFLCHFMCVQPTNHVVPLMKLQALQI